MKSFSLVKQYLRDMVIKEAEGEDAGSAQAPADPPAVEGNDSLDLQVDKYLSGYEQEAADAAQSEYGYMAQEHVDFRQMTREFLFEAPEDEQGNDDQTDTDTGDETDAGDTGGDEDPLAEPEGPAKKSLGEIDIRVYAEDVARLIDNAQNLIEIKNTVLRRAINRLGKTYDESVIRQLEIVLEEEFGLAVGKSEKDLEDEIQAPAAANAGPLGG